MVVVGKSAYLVDVLQHAVRVYRLAVEYEHQQRHEQRYAEEIEHGTQQYGYGGRHAAATKRRRYYIDYLSEHIGRQRYEKPSAEAN